MDNVVLDSRRRFQIWRALVSHSQLLLVSTKTAEHPTRLDVLFKSVAANKLLWSMQGLSIARADAAQAKLVGAECGPAFIHGELQIFLVKDTLGFNGWVIAGAVATHESDHEYDEPSVLL
jgi:hypothetical protein